MNNYLSPWQSTKYFQSVCIKLRWKLNLFSKKSDDSMMKIGPENLIINLSLSQATAEMYAPSLKKGTHAGLQGQLLVQQHAPSLHWNWACCWFGCRLFNPMVGWSLMDYALAKYKSTPNKWYLDSFSLYDRNSIENLCYFTRADHNRFLFKKQWSP